jgi:putative ABC transport system substrate-binding protein
LLGSAATASLWPPLAARAQQGKLPTIGFLGTDTVVWRPWVDAFVERLRALGWIEGRSVAIEYRWDEGRLERAAEAAAEFVRLKVDVIVTVAAVVPVVRRATGVIPIVFALSIDPVSGGLVASLARPGGNVTGLSLQSPDLAGKRLELLREMVPEVRRVAILGDGDFAESVVEIGQVRAAASALGLDAVVPEIRRAEDIAAAIATLKHPADAIYVASDALVNVNRGRVIANALDARLPTMFGSRDHARAGALMSYGASFPDLFRRAAEYVDKILHGAKPADIPVEQPTKFELVVNLKTAKALGLKIPDAFLLRADEVIE